MNTPHSPLSAPRKELVGRLQKHLVTLLLLLIVLGSALYSLMSTHYKKNDVLQQEIDELSSSLHHVQVQWLELLLINNSGAVLGDDLELSSRSAIQKLISEYHLIVRDIEVLLASDAALLTDSMEFLKGASGRSLMSEPLSKLEQKQIEAFLGSLEKLKYQLIKMDVDLSDEHQLFTEKLIWLTVSALLFFALVAIFMTISVCRQLRLGLSQVHDVLNHHKRSHVSNTPKQAVVDEFTDLVHSIDNEFASGDFDVKLLEENLSLIGNSLTKVELPFFVINSEGYIACLSAGAEKLWFKNAPTFETLFEIESGLESPVGEKISDSILLSDGETSLNLLDGVYCLEVCPFDSEINSSEESGSESSPRVVTVKLTSEMAEFGVLHHSLKLMEQDVWQIPVRLLRDGSPYVAFAQSLESIRLKVVSIFNTLEKMSEKTVSPLKITKLQQIASLIDVKPDHNKDQENDIAYAPSVVSSEEVRSELHDMSMLSDQIHDSLILGYELVLQRLALIEKDMSSDMFLLKDVDRYINEVRAGVLSSLSATEGESESVRRRFSVDLEHDISEVQNQIENMKAMAGSTLSLLQSDQSVGVARLDRARESVQEISEKIHKLMLKVESESPEGEG